MYAKSVKKMSKSEKAFDAIEAAQLFGDEVSKLFVGFERAYRGGYCAVYSDDSGAAVVRCPECNAIQVCWGEYGDPATEVCVCSKCGSDYETEPF